MRAEEVLARTTLSSMERGTATSEQLAESLPFLADEGQRAQVRAALLKQPQRRELAALLAHERLAVRLGALEVLEEMGGVSDFDPWLAPGAEENTAALARWRSWAAEETPGDVAAGGVFSEAQWRNYVREVLGESPEKASRARRILEAEGFVALAALESFRKEHPDLPLVQRTRLREAQYQIVLGRFVGTRAATLARQLTFGNRDQLLTALSALRGGTELAVPVLMDFVRHEDALVRETAIDALLACGGEEAFALISPSLKYETEDNVIYGVLRGLRDIRTPAAQNFTAGLITNGDEDLAVAAIQTAIVQREIDSDGAMDSAAIDAAVLTALGSPHWRVRAVALEYVAMKRVKKAVPQVLTALEDDDEFVRVNAMKAAVAMSLQEALPRLKRIFLESNTMSGPVFSTYTRISGGAVDSEMQARLDRIPAEEKIAVLQDARDRGEVPDLVLRLARDVDLDVACGALRLLGSDSDNLTREAVVKVLLAALEEGVAEKQRAVLQQLKLPKAPVRELGATMAPAKETALDSLFEAVGDVPVAVHSAQEGKSGTPLTTLERLVAEVERLTAEKQPELVRFAAALALLQAHYPTGATTLVREYPGLSAAQKTKVAEQMYSPCLQEETVLLRLLLADEAEMVRQAAAEATASGIESPGFAELLAEALDDSRGRLQPYEVYSYRLGQALEREVPGTLRSWAEKELRRKGSTPARRVLAMTIVAKASARQMGDRLRELAAEENLWVRRAAWQSLGWLRPRDFASYAEEILNDSSPQVREIFPLLFVEGNSMAWHYFDDLHRAADYFSTYDGRGVPTARAGGDTMERLQRLARTDPVPVVRFWAWMALLTQRQPVDADAMAALVGQMPEEVTARERVARWMRDNPRRVTPTMQPLFAVLGKGALSERELQQVRTRLGMSGATNRLPESFAALASGGKPEVVVENGVGEESPAKEIVAARKSLPVVFFYKPGCPECAKAAKELESLKNAFPGMEVREVNILEPDGTLLNQIICGRLHMPAAKRMLAPSVFTQEGGLALAEVEPRKLAELFARTQAVRQDDGWMAMDEGARRSADAAVVETYSALTFWVVLGAGLVDGVNPCAFATIVFFLSYLQVMRRSSREMLLTGAAFIGGVFVAYFLAGLALYQVLDGLHRFAWLQRSMNLVFGGLALLAALLSLRDAWKARQGKFGEMTLQLPGFIKERIRTNIREGARARRFVTAAFVTGVIISFLELACTGQVYAPIIYQIQQGRMGAVGMLTVYNLAFIAPLVALFMATWMGMRSEVLLNWQRKHTASVKIALAGLFLLLAALIFLH